MTKQIGGSVRSGWLAQQLWTEGEVYIYSYNHGRRGFRLKLLHDGKQNYFCTDLNGNNKRPFDFYGFLYSMDNEAFHTVVFTNCWLAFAYEQYLKQAA